MSWRLWGVGAGLAGAIVLVGCASGAVVGPGPAALGSRTAVRADLQITSSGGAP